jgi:hypothetical protein
MALIRGPMLIVSPSFATSSTTCAFTHR